MTQVCREPFPKVRDYSLKKAQDQHLDILTYVGMLSNVSFSKKIRMALSQEKHKHIYIASVL